MSEYCFTSLSAQSWQFRDRRNPEIGTMSYSYRMTSRVLYSAQYHWQHCTHQAVEHFGSTHTNNYQLANHYAMSATCWLMVCQRLNPWHTIKPTLSRHHMTDDKILSYSSLVDPNYLTTRGFATCVCVATCDTTSQQTQNICITFVQRRPNVFDVGPILCKCYTNVLWLLGSYQYDQYDNYRNYW